MEGSDWIPSRPLTGLSASGSDSGGGAWELGHIARAGSTSSHDVAFRAQSTIRGDWFLAMGAVDITKPPLDVVLMGAEWLEGGGVAGGKLPGKDHIHIITGNVYFTWCITVLCGG